MRRWTAGVVLFKDQAEPTDEIAARPRVLDELAAARVVEMVRVSEAPARRERARVADYVAPAVLDARRRALP